MNSGEIYSGEDTQGEETFAKEKIYDDQDDHKNEEHLEEIVTERMAEEIEDDLTTLQQKNNQSPLVFYGNLGSSYLFSFKKKELGPFMVKVIGIMLFYIFLLVFIWKVATVEHDVKQMLTILSVAAVVSFLLVFFLDPGTLMEDQEQKIDEDRLYCQQTKHCSFCVKCVKGYDHHCSFFGKCIGQRNYIVFVCFFLTGSAVGMGSMVSLVYTIFNYP